MTGGCESVPDRMLDKHQFVMFVEIAQQGKFLHPVASVIRLQLSDCIYMHVAQSGQVGFSPFPETVWRVFDRELCASVAGATVQNGELSNQVVKGRTETVGGIARKDSTSVWNLDSLAPIGVCDDPCVTRWYRHIRPRLDDNSLGLIVANLDDQGVKLDEMFMAPVALDVGVLEGGFRHEQENSENIQGME